MTTLDSLGVSFVCIVKFLLSPNTKAEQRKGTKTWKTNVRIVIYWESVSNSVTALLAAARLAGICLISDGSRSIVCLHNAPPLSRSFGLMLHISVLIQMLRLYILQSRLAQGANNSVFNDKNVLPFVKTINTQIIPNL